jgi:hypothetical protein
MGKRIRSDWLLLVMPDGATEDGVQMLAAANNPLAARINAVWIKMAHLAESAEDSHKM